MLEQQEHETTTAWKKRRNPDLYERKFVRTKILKMVYFDSGSNTSNRHPMRVKHIRSDEDKSLLIVHIRELLPETGWLNKTKERIIENIQRTEIHAKTIQELDRLSDPNSFDNPNNPLDN